MALVVAKDVLMPVLCSWIPSHCHSARFKLQTMLGLPGTVDTDTASPCGHEGKTTVAGFRVKVETVAGAIVAQLRVDQTATVRDVKTKVAQVAPQFPVTAQRFFVSGCEKHGVLPDEVDSVGLKVVVEHILTAQSKLRPRQRQQADDGSKAKVSSTANPNAKHDASVTEKVFLKGGDEICLCLVVDIARWSKTRSSHALQISLDGRQISLPESLPDGVHFAVGAILLNEPGDFFTVQVQDTGTVGSAHVGYMSVGIACASISTDDWTSFDWSSLGSNTVSMWSTHDRQGIQVFGNEPCNAQRRPWRSGDRVTLSLLQRKDRTLALVCTVNGEVAYNVSVSRKPPFMPLCKLAHKGCLVMVRGQGQSLGEEMP